jgi:uncharacterized protein (TIGR02611 family)
MGDDTQPAVVENLSEAWRKARRTVVFIVGCSIILIGCVLLILPGPASVVIPVGLAILATEFVWARRLLRKARDQGAQLVKTVWSSEQDSGVDEGAGESAPNPEQEERET